MDSQDVLAYGEIIPEKFNAERVRIHNMCDWARNFPVDGFVRYVVNLDGVTQHVFKFSLLEWKWTCKSCLLVVQTSFI